MIILVKEQIVEAKQWMFTTMRDVKAVLSSGKGVGAVTFRLPTAAEREGYPDAELVAEFAPPDGRVVVPLRRPVRWFDERLCCAYVCMGERPPTGCSSQVARGQTAHGPRPYPDGTCMMCPPLPCAFDDPAFDWERAAALKKREEELECLPAG